MFQLYLKKRGIPAEYYLQPAEVFKVITYFEVLLANFSMDPRTNMSHLAPLDVCIKSNVSSEIPDTLDEALQMVNQLSVVADKQIGSHCLNASSPEIYNSFEVFVKSCKASGCVNSAGIKADFTYRVLTVPPRPTTLAELSERITD
jgi:hypothetical protein